MRKIIILGAILFNLQLSAQIILKGYVYDDISSETLIGANIIASNGSGTVSDLEGYFELVLPKGEVVVRVSYVGYKEEKKTLKLNQNTTINFYLSTQILDEVQVVSDIARSRETPVAFSNISPKKIEEELAGQDIPMILNSTPGVYATQSGGGDGDARISIRGFNQRNVAVMIDGIPMNDMENGNLYGAITLKEICNELYNSSKIEIKPEQIELPKSIKSKGEYKFKINLHADVQSEVLIDILAKE